MATSQDFVVKKGLDLNGTVTIRSNGSQIGTVTNGASSMNITATANGLKVGTSGAYPLIGVTNGVEVFRADASGNVGVGVTPSAWTSAAKAIQVGAGGAMRGSTSDNSIFEIGTNFYAAAAGGNKYIGDGPSTVYEQKNGAHQWHVAPSGSAGAPVTFTKIMVLDASGNLGIGVTPSAWNGNYRAIEIQNGSISSSTSNAVRVNNNVVFGSSATTYKVTTFATSYLQYQGQHQWYTAPSGNAGDPITFTQTMTLDANGNLALGLTSGNLSGYGAGVRVFTVQGNSLPGAIELALNLATSQNNTLGEINFVNNASTVTSKQSAYITGFQDGTSTTAPGGGIRFTTRTDGGNLAERLRITNTGNVGIGTSTPGTLLGFVNGAQISWGTSNFAYVSGSSVTNVLTFGTQATERMRIDAAGNLLVGSTLARSTGWTGSLSALTVTKSSSNSVIDLMTYSTVTNNTSVLVLGKSASGVIGSNSETVNGQQLGVISFEGVHIGGTRSPGASINAYQTAAATATGIPSAIALSTYSGTALLERMRVDSNGNVGIGTSSPDVQLSVLGSVRVGTGSPTPGYTGVILASTATDTFTTDTDKVIHHYGITAKEFSDVVGAPSVVVSGYAGMRFYTNGSERLRITNPGNVGIGTASPSQKLHVVGSSLFLGSGAFSAAWGDTTGLGYLTFDGSGNPVIRSNTGLPLVFQTNGTSERMRIDASGGLLVGANSFSGWVSRAKIKQSNITKTGGLVIEASSNTVGISIGHTGTAGYIGSNFGSAGDSYTPLIFQTSDLDRLTIDTSGNVGVGQSPTTFNKFSTASSVGITSNGTKGTMGEVFANPLIAGLRANSYYDSGTAQVKATSTGYSPEIQLRTDNGAIVFNRSTSAAIDAVVSQAESMRIDASGNVGIGLTDPTTVLTGFSGGSTGVAIASAGVPTLALYDSENSTYKSYVANSSGDMYVSNSATGKSLIFSNAGSERMRLDANGNLGIGQPAPISRIHVSESGGGLLADFNGPSSLLQFRNDRSEIFDIRTGTNDSLAIWTNNVERMRLDVNGNLGIGVTPAYRVHAKLDQNGITSNVLVNSNGGNAATTRFLAAADTASLAMEISSSSHATKASQAWIYNTGAFPVVFGTNSVERMRLDASGNFVYTYGGGAMGYGAGSGGTVTQATSKSTSVSLNKPSGQITLNAASLASNATIMFALNNTLISATDVILVHRASGGTGASYQVWVDSVAAGTCNIAVRNINASALAEAIVLNFQIHKGATA